MAFHSDGDDGNDSGTLALFVIFRFFKTYFASYCREFEAPKVVDRHQTLIFPKVGIMKAARGVEINNG